MATAENIVWHECKMGMDGLKLCGEILPQDGKWVWWRFSDRTELIARMKKDCQDHFFPPCEKDEKDIVAWGEGKKLYRRLLESRIYSKSWGGTMNTTKRICTTALGIALYVALSMTVKIPLVAHISLDLGYIVFAVYCYHFGPIAGSVVGGCGCVLISLITSGWFPPGWLLGQIAIGAICGGAYKISKGDVANCVKAKMIVAEVMTAIIAVGFGICLVKTFVECVLYSIPLSVKLISNGVAAATDAIVMSAGVLFARKLTPVVEKLKVW